MSKLLFLFILFSIFVVHASAQTDLATHPEWLFLNAYKAKGEQWESDIRNDDFFISKTGRTNPQAELEAFINLAKAAETDQKKRQHLCKYPARLDFLKMPDGLCANTETGRLISNTESISLIFADGFFGNPASYYGHVLLKLNSKTKPQQGEFGLLDTSINYGAHIPQNENIINYLTKGIFGYYRASFQPNDFFLNTVQYADLQARDFWAYDLNLTRKQALYIARRAIELQTADFDYFFFGDNCAHRIRDLLREATGQEIATDNGAWFIPMQLIRGVANTNLTSGKPLVSKVRYLPSSRNRLLAQLAVLSSEQQNQLIKLLDGMPVTDISLEPTHRKQILVAADTHLRNNIIVLNRKEEDKAQLQKQQAVRQSVLLDLIGLQQTKIDDIKPNTPPLPHVSGRNGTALFLTALNDNDGKSGAELTLRPAYTDHLAPDIGKISNSTLHMGLVQIRQSNNTVRLDHLTFVEVENLTTAPIDKRFAPGRVWSISTGLTRNGMRANAPLVSYLSAGIGKDVSWGKFHSYAIVFAHAGEQDVLFNKLSGGAKAGLILRVNDHLKGALTSEWREKRNGAFYHHTKLAFRAVLSSNVDIQLAVDTDNDEQDQWRLGLIKYF